MLELVLGSTTRSVTLHIEDNVICDTLGVEFSSKKEANQTFFTRFEFIGTEFNTNDPTDIIRSPARHLRESIERDLAWLEANSCHLVDKSMVQRMVGRLTFCARFSEHGRMKMNTACAALAGAWRLQCLGQKHMISKEMACDVEAIAGEIRVAQWAPLVATPTFAFPARRASRQAHR